jgi:hypothetical protein
VLTAREAGQANQRIPDTQVMQHSKSGQLLLKIVVILLGYIRLSKYMRASLFVEKIANIHFN